MSHCVYQAVKCILPRGYILEEGETIEDKFKGKYPNGEKHFRITGSKVERLCPCGLTKCNYHVIPTEMHFEGPMMHNGTDLSKLFVKEPVMTYEDAREWWKQYGLACIKEDRIIRTVFTDWKLLYDFPAGHELLGTVQEGTEDEKVKEHFSTVYQNGAPKYRITDKHSASGAALEAQGHCFREQFPRSRCYDLRRGKGLVSGPPFEMGCRSHSCSCETPHEVQVSKDFRHDTL